MSPVASCRLVRLVPFRAVLSGLRVVLCRPVPPKSAWFVCKRFLQQGKQNDKNKTDTSSWGEGG